MQNRDNLQEIVVGRLSCLGRKWFLRKSTEDKIKDIARRYDLDDTAAGLLASREVDDLENFLQPTLKHYLPDPYDLADMQKATMRVLSAIEAKESILLYGDYDVDGASSVSLLQGFLSAIGHNNFSVYIPDRYKEGYGVHEAAIDKFVADGHDLVITMDCGTSSFTAMAKARLSGLDVIILDHHKPDSELPEAFALVNPNVVSNGADIQARFGILAAVGVTYLFLIALRRCLRERGFFAGQAEPDLLDSLDLVALGTVCDVVPLAGLNRAFVYQGLKIMNRHKRIGVRALCQVSGVEAIDKAIDSGDLGFQLGPRLNAGARMGESGLARQLLACQDEDEALALAYRLHDLNEQRKSLQAEHLSEVIHSVKDYLHGRNDVNHILVSGDNWRSGLVGVLAGRVKGQYCYPSIVIGFEGDIGSGSGRSVEGVDLGSVVLAAVRAGILVRGGGHAMAAGLTIMRDRVEEFDEFLQGHIFKQLDGAGIVPELLLDIELSLSSVSGGLWDSLNYLSPYGSGNDVPLLLFRGVRVSGVEFSRDGKHLFCRLYDGGGGWVRGVVFNAVDHILGGILVNLGSDVEVDIVGRLGAPWGDGRVVSVMIEDCA